MKKLATTAVAATLLMVVAACSSGNSKDGAATGTTPSGDSNTGSGQKVGMLLTGAINDNDWNYVGYQALMGIKDQLNANTSYIENVGVADAARQANQLISNHYNTVIFDSSVYLNASLTVAKANPDVHIITQNATGAMPDQPKNLWIVQLRFYPGEYVLGYAAGLLAKESGGKACWMSGLSVPDTIAAANGSIRGMKAADNNLQVEYTFTGDFDDATKARQAAAAMIADGCRSFVVHLNGAVSGVVQAIKDSDKDIHWLGLYTDKHEIDPDHYVGGYEFDFTKAYLTAMEKIQGGTNSGVYDLGQEIALTSLYNLSSDQQQKVKDVFDKVVSGEIEVPAITDKVVVP